MHGQIYMRIILNSNKVRFDIILLQNENVRYLNKLVLLHF